MPRHLRREITREYTPLLLILQGMTLQLQGMTLPPLLILQDTGLRLHGPHPRLLVPECVSLVRVRGEAAGAQAVRPVGPDRGANPAPIYSRRRGVSPSCSAPGSGLDCRWLSFCPPNFRLRCESGASFLVFHYEALHAFSALGLGQFSGRAQAHCEPESCPDPRSA